MKKLVLKELVNPETLTNQELKDLKGGIGLRSSGCQVDCPSGVICGR